MNLKQTILSSFGRDDLKRLLDELGIDGVDRRSVEAMRAKLGRSRSVSAETLLDGMRKDKIKQVCEDIGVPSAGTKQELIDRLMSNGSTSAKPAGNGKKTMSETSETKATEEPKAERSNGGALDLPALEQWLWDAACTIRGPIDAPKYKNYILPLIFLKRLSDVFDDEVTHHADAGGHRHGPHPRSCAGQLRLRSLLWFRWPAHQMPSAAAVETWAEVEWKSEAPQDRCSPEAVRSGDRRFDVCHRSHERCAARHGG